MKNASNALVDTIENAGVLHCAVISAAAFEGLRVETLDGRPASLAVIDEQGKVIESGEQVMDEVWNIAMLAYRLFLKGQGRLHVRASPAGITQEPEE